MEGCLPPCSRPPHHSLSSSPDQASSNNSLSDISSSFMEQEYDWASLQQQQQSNADSCNAAPTSASFLSTISDFTQLNADQFGGFNLNFVIASSRHPQHQQHQQQQIQYVSENMSCFQTSTPSVHVKPLKSLKRESPDQSPQVNQISCDQDSSPSSARSGVFNPHCPDTEHQFNAAPQAVEHYGLNNKRMCLDQNNRWSTPSPSESKQKLSNVSFIGPALNTNGRPRAKRGSATDPQSVYARHRRERINERLKTLQHLVPNGAKVDIVTMLEEAIHYVKFLQLQVNMLNSDEYWIYAPTTYNGPETSLPLMG